MVSKESLFYRETSTGRMNYFLCEYSNDINLNASTTTIQRISIRVNCVRMIYFRKRMKENEDVFALLVCRDFPIS